MKSVNHKRLITSTIVTPSNRKAYVRENVDQVLCGKTLYAIRQDDEYVTPYDEDTTCPDCLAKLNGRREGNKDIMIATAAHQRLVDKYRYGY
jgi:hypothetical protein